LVLLVGGAAVAVRVFLPPAKVKALALDKLGETLGREVRLADASLRLSGVRLVGLEVSEVPDFKAGKAFKAKSVTATPRWWPLLARRELLISAVDVEAPEVWVSPAPARKAPAGAPASPAAPAAAAAFSVSSLRAHGGSLTYKDAGGMTASLKGLDLNAKDLRPDGPVPYSLSFEYETRSAGARHAGRVEVQGSVDAAGGDLAKAWMAFEPLSLTLDGLKARATGKVTGFASPKLEAELTLPRLERSEAPFLAAAPEGFALPALSGPLKAAVTAKGLQLETLELKGEGAALSLKAAQDGTRWKVPATSASWGAVRLSASGSADTGAKGGAALDFKAELEPLALAEAAKLVPGGASYEAGGTLSAELAAKGAAADPALSGVVTLKDASFVVSKQRLTGLEAKLSLAPDTAAGTLKGKVNGADFEAKLDGKDLRKAPRLRLDARLAKLDLSTLPPAKGAAKEGGGKNPVLKPAAEDPAAKPFHVQGTLTVGSIKHPNFEASETKLTVDLKGRGADPARMDGTMALRVGPGRFEDMSLLAAEKPAVKLLLLPVVILQKAASFVKVPFFPRFDTFTFSEIRGDYLLTAGLLTVRESKLDGATADAELAGTADLPKDAVDMRVKVKFGGQGAIRMGATVPFTVTGKLSDPKVKVDPISILRQPSVEKAVEKAVDPLLKQGSELFKGLFK
jgi:hypothetical protein